MPEIKHNFTGGKMNKDLDERLIQNGEYRDALNIQVSTSENSEVGTIQNILGNKNGCAWNSSNPNPIPLGSKTVGSVSDEKNDTLYWMVAGPTIDIQEANFCTSVATGLATPMSFKDLIMRKQGSDIGSCSPVFVDKHTVLLSNMVGGSFVNSANDNILNIDNSVFLDEITAGMTVSGLSNNCVLSPAYDPPMITSIGNLSSFQTVFIPETVTTTTTGQVQFTNVFVGSSYNTEVSPAVYVPEFIYIPYSQLSAYNNFPQVGDDISVIAGAPCGSIFVGEIASFPNGTLQTQLYTDPSQSAQMNVGGFLQVQVGSAVDPTQNWVCSGTGSPYVTFAQPNANQYGLLFGQAVPYTPSGEQMMAPPPWTGTGPDPQFIVTLELESTNTLPTNIITLPPNNPYLDEIYELFYPGGVFTPGNGQIVFSPDTLNYISAGIGDECCILPESNWTPSTNQFQIVDCLDMQSSCAPSAAPASNMSYTTTISTPPQTSPPLGTSVITLDSNLDLTAGYDYLVFQRSRVLNFHKDKLITGINIVDDMLYWVDGVEHSSLDLSRGGTEPKKINITRSVQGTDTSGNKHTQIVNRSLGPGIDGEGRQDMPVLEEHISVIRNSPKEKPTIKINSGRPEGGTYAGVTQIGFDPGTGIRESLLLPSTGGSFYYNFSSVSVGDSIRVMILTDIDDNTEFTLDWPIETGNLEVVLKEFDENGNAPIIPIGSNYRIKGTIEPSWSSTSLTGDSNATGYAPFGPIDTAGTWKNGVAMVQIKVTSIVGFPPLPEDGATNLKYAIDIFQSNERLYEFKFPRFSYRYKYEDGETSTFAPWSEIAFLPGAFDYHPTKGYNLGMTNRMVSVDVEGFTNNIPKDVVAVDILYKEEGNPNCFVVDTVKPSDPPYQGANFNSWYSGTNGQYTIKRETIKSILPENQLLRAYDNVPRKALAQEVTGNRVVYGNYIQNFNLKSPGIFHDYSPDFNVGLTTYLIPEGGAPFHMRSIKSLREYQLGVVFTDKYGRETPVLSKQGSSINLPKENAATNNRLKLAFNNIDSPAGMEYFKFYIKETSGQYYNVAMDRFYNAEDGNIWLAFPSTDVNKVDIDSFLVLKKGIDSNELITNPARYKVIAIENEAPDFVKTSVLNIGVFRHAPLANSALFGDDNSNAGSTQTTPLLNAPVFGDSTFDAIYSRFEDTSANNLHEITDGELYVEFEYNQIVTDRYKIVNVTVDDDDNPIKYHFKIDGTFGSDVNTITDDPDGTNSTEIKDGVKMRLFKYKVENKPQFDGRFFVKIYNDLVFQEYISDTFTTEINYRVVSKKKIFSIENEATMNSVHRYAAISPQGLDKVANAPTTTDPAIPTPNVPQGGPKQHITRQAYFGEAFWYQPAHLGITSYDDVKFKFPHRDLKFDTPNNGGYFEDVWFIDKGKHNMTRIGDDAVWYSTVPDMDNNFYPPFSPYVDSLGLGVSFAGTNDTKSRVDLAIGGITNIKMYEGCASYHCGCSSCWDTTPGYGNDEFPNDSNWEAVGLYDSKLNNISNFFNVGTAGGNSAYDNEHTRTFVDKIQSGSRFRWKEDPTETIYTIEDQIIHGRYAQFSRRIDSAQNKRTGFLSANPANFHKTFRYNCVPAMNGWNPVAVYGQAIPNGLRIGPVKDSVDVELTLASTTIQFNQGTSIPERLRVGMRVTGNNGTTTTVPANTFITSIDRVNDEITISNPALANSTTTHEFGFTIRTIGGSSLSLPNPYIKVDSIDGLCSNNAEKFSIAEGQMALTAYNNNTALPGGYLLVKNIIENGPNNYTIEFTGYTDVLTSTDLNFTPTAGKRLVFQQVSMNSASPYTTINIDKSIVNDGAANDRSSIGAVGYTLEFLEESITSGTGEGLTSNPLPDNPAIWETEPKETTDLNIYYEASDYYPTKLTKTNISYVLPIGSSVYNENDNTLGTIVNNSVTASGDIIGLSTPVLVEPGGFTDNDGNYTSPFEVGSIFNIVKPNGESISISVVEIIDDPTYQGQTPAQTRFFRLDNNLLKAQYFLNWHNCYSFGNGVESNRVRDNFNLPYILNGVKASTVLPDKYEEEHRKHGLIYSGIYNSNSGINNLNQFIQAEKITKDINPIYGSIQKLHSRDTDLVTLCEDKVLKILANKDAVFNADGKPQLTATENVLGQTIPFIGEYGISKNPESFASEAYRAYFSDKVRGAIIRLSKDGLTPISEHGMKDWFRDNLKLCNTIFGSYDDYKQEYNVTLLQDDASITEVVSSSQINVITTNNTTTVSFNENVRGWVSFKSFTPENAISCANKYYTFMQGNLWQHHFEGTSLVPWPRNKFYNQQYKSTFNVILNSDPGSIKSFQTLNYEGSQSKVDVPMIPGYIIPSGFAYAGLYIPAQPAPDGNYYNLDSEKGWYVESISTDQEKGEVPEFIEKEGKWFNWIRGKNPNFNIQGYLTNDYGDFDEEAMAVQGLGKPVEITSNAVDGCTDPTAINYDPNANTDDGSCIAPIYGCTDPNADLGSYDPNANPLPNTDDGSCLYLGCLSDPGAVNYGGPGSGVIPEVTNDDGSCIATVLGCTDITAFNYDQLANVDDGSCYPYIYGCTDGTTPADNFIPLTGNVQTDVNTEDSSCTYGGCTSPSATNYLVPGTDCDSAIPYPNPSSNPLPPCPTFDNGSCIYPVISGCTDSSACNYDPLASVDNGECFTMGCSITSVDITNYGYYLGEPTGGAIQQLGQNIVGTGVPPIAAEYDCGCTYCEPPTEFTIVDDVFNLNTGTTNFELEWKSPGTSFNLSNFESFRIQWRYQNTPWSIPLIIDNNDITIAHNTYYTTFLNDILIIANDPNQSSIDVRIRTFCNGDNAQNSVPKSQAPQTGDAFINNFAPINTPTITGCTCNGNQPNFAGVVNDCYGDGIPSLNYNPNANSPATGIDPSCIQSIPGCTCGGDSINGTLNGLGIYNDCWGNGYPSDNFDPNATVDDGSCLQSAGCTDPTALNYDSTASAPNGNCVYTCDPISNLTVSNISATGATISWDQSPVQPWGNFGFDGSGLTVNAFGTRYMKLVLKMFDDNTQSYTDVILPSTVPAPANSAPESQIFLDDDARIFGYYNFGANSFITQTVNNPAGNTDQGETTQVEIATALCDDFAWVLGGPNYNTSFNSNCQSTAATSTHMCPSCDPINANSNSVLPGQGAPGYLKPNTQYKVEYEVFCTGTSSSGVVSTTFTTSHIDGCMDSTADNYNPYATQSDGSCFVSGCTDSTATNYDPNATVDDGSCVYPIIGCAQNNIFGYQHITNTYGTTNNPFNSDCSNALNPGSTSDCTDGVTFDEQNADSSCRYNTFISVANGSVSTDPLEKANSGYYSFIGQMINFIGEFGSGFGSTSNHDNSFHRGYKVARYHIAGYSVGGGNPYTNYTTQNDMTVTNIGFSTYTNPTDLSPVTWESFVRLTDGTQPSFGAAQTPTNQFFDNDATAGYRKYVDFPIFDANGNMLQPDTQFKVKITKSVSTYDGNGVKTVESGAQNRRTLPCVDIPVTTTVVGSTLQFDWNSPWNAGENTVGNTLGHPQFVKIVHYIPNSNTNPTSHFIAAGAGAQQFTTPTLPAGNYAVVTGAMCFSGLRRIDGSGGFVNNNTSYSFLDQWDWTIDGQAPFVSGYVIP